MTSGKLTILICAALVCGVSRAGAESVFTYDIKKDAVIGSAALGMFITPFFVNNEPDGIPHSLDKSEVNGFDRAMMFPYIKSLDIASDFGVYGMLVLPIMSLAGNITDKTAWISYGVMYAEAFLLTYGTKELLKNAVIRYRPYMYAGGIPSGKEDDYYNSFPSGSTALAFLSAGFLSATFLAEYPDSRWKIPVAGGAYALAAAVAVSRILSGSHFPTDVLAGAAIGSLYGWLMPLLHKRHSGEGAVRAFFTGSGLVVSIAV
jgi:membrane-associated phospholipid phosphatase